MLFAAHASFHCLTGAAPAASPWRFDVTSAMIGAAVALLLVWLAYRFHDVLRLGWETVTAPLIQLVRHLQASVEERYRERIAQQARSLTILRDVVPLDAVFIEPELAPPPSLPQPASDVELMRVSPLRLPAGRILGRHHKLAILGPPGSGRTTLLAHMALYCAGATRDGKRHGEDSQAKAGAEHGMTSGAAGERLPLYVLLPTLDWDATGGAEEPEGNKKDGDGAIERLLSAGTAIAGGSGRIAKTFKSPKNSAALRRRLEAGEAIVLVDGWDELSTQHRRQAAAWLSELTDILPENIWLVGAGTRGYAALTEAGFTPLTLLPWRTDQIEAFAGRWVEAYAPSGTEHPIASHRVAIELRQAAADAGTVPLPGSGPSPAELALRAFVFLSDGRTPDEQAALFERALDLLLPQEEELWFSAACRAALGQVALNLQQEGRATAGREEIETAIEAALPPPEERPNRAGLHVIRALTGERGLLRPVDSGRYVFTHPLWQAYLAARQLAAGDPAAGLVERLDDDRWNAVMRFYAELGDMRPLVTAWLREPDDMFHKRLHVLSSWISAAPGDAKWRDGAMAVLARTFLQPGQPAQIQRALAEALATTGMSGVVYFFKQALKHPDAEVRIAATLGLIKMADESDLPMLEAFLEDDSPTVREAAVRRLAHLEAKASIRLLGQILLAGEETLRPAAAKALAARGAAGLSILREATELEDVTARRAAVFGLAQLKARDTLEKVAREDEQWIVRSAASAALEEMDEQDRISGVTPPPEAGQFPWLISWAAARGEAVGLGDAARRMLRRALSEGEAPIRLAATQALAQIGRPDDVEPLRARLSDPDPTVASAALDALEEIARRYELRIT